jgi:hypothetical protein
MQQQSLWLSHSDDESIDFHKDNDSDGASSVSSLDETIGDDLSNADVSVADYESDTSPHTSSSCFDFIGRLMSAYVLSLFFCHILLLGFHLMPIVLFPCYCSGLALCLSTFAFFVLLFPVFVSLSIYRRDINIKLIYLIHLGLRL